MMQTPPKPFRLRWPHYVLALLVYLAFLLAWAPASLLAWALPRASQQMAWLDRAHGTLWRGGAETLGLRPASGPVVSLGRVNWRLQPLELLRGRLGYHLTLEGDGIQAAATVQAARSRVALQALHAEAAADWLGRLTPEVGMWQPQGRLLLEARTLTFEKASVSGQGSLRWLDAASGLTREPFGSYRAELEGNDTGLAIKLSTENGALLLQGNGVWTVQRGLQFAGTARAASGAHTANFLGILGPPRADGSRPIRIGS